jgi:hypothetical protein
MNELSQEQRAHLNNRIADITADKINAKREELFGKGGNEYTVTWGEMFAAIKAGDVELKEGEEGNTNAYLLPNQVQWPARKAKVAELKAYEEQVGKESQALYDRFVFNNVSGLTDALDEFAKA